MSQSLSISLRVTAALASVIPVLALVAYTRSLAEVAPAMPAQAEATVVQRLSPIVVTAKRAGGKEAKVPAKASTAGA